jgi:hypothetical protein
LLVNLFDNLVKYWYFFYNWPLASLIYSRILTVFVISCKMYHLRYISTTHTHIFSHLLIPSGQLHFHSFLFLLFPFCPATPAFSFFSIPFSFSSFSLLPLSPSTPSLYPPRTAAFSFFSIPFLFFLFFASFPPRYFLTSLSPTGSCIFTSLPPSISMT